MCCFIIFPSVTYAQRGEDSLAHNGVISHVVRTPSEIGAGVCSYALRVGDRHCKRALEVLKSARLPYTKAVLFDGTYHEASL